MHRYDILQKELMNWVWNNGKLRQKITRHNLRYLFEFDKQRRFSIDLRRFEPEYYREVFYLPEEKKNTSTNSFENAVSSSNKASL